MSPKEFTVEIIEEKLLELMNEKPNFIYNKTETGSVQCFYDKGVSENNQCDGCIFGQAFQRLGMSKEDLSSHTEGVMSLPFLEFTPPWSWNGLQQAQDDGAPWGKLKELLTTIDQTND